MSDSAKQGFPLSPTPFFFAMHTFLETLEAAMAEDTKLHFRTGTGVCERCGKPSVMEAY